MAKLTFVPGKKRVVIDPPKITLELDKNEALTLKLILGGVGGCPSTSARKYAQSVHDALGTKVGSTYGLELGTVRGDGHSIYLDKVGLDMKPKK